MNTAENRDAIPKHRAITWGDVLGVLQDAETRSRATSHFRSLGFTADDFASKQAAKRAAVEALVKVEDWLEMEHPGRKADRASIKALRRVLERAVWV